MKQHYGNFLFTEQNVLLCVFHEYHNIGVRWHPFVWCDTVDTNQLNCLVHYLLNSLVQLKVIGILHNGFGQAVDCALSRRLCACVSSRERSKRDDSLAAAHTRDNRSARLVKVVWRAVAIRRQQGHCSGVIRIRNDARIPPPRKSPSLITSSLRDIILRRSERSVWYYQCSEVQ